jgi:hypothetical protein
VFDGSTSSDVDGTIAEFAWDFGDGNTGTGVNPTHTYAAPGDYTVSLTVTDDDGNPSGPVSQVVTVVGPPTEYALDTFTRNEVNGLGIADIGGVWTLAGTATAFSVVGDAGRIAGAVAANRAGYLTGVMQTDMDFTTDIALDSPATGGGAYVSVIGRRVSNNNDYRLLVRYLPGGVVQAFIVRTVNGGQTFLASTTVPGLTVAPGEALRARFVVDGSPATLRAKVWRASEPQPEAWLLTANDATASLQSPGGVGILLYVSGSWSGAAPAIVIDNVKVAAPED